MNNLDHEEQKILASFEKGAWRPIKNLEQEKALAQQIAAETLLQLKTASLKKPPLSLSKPDA